MHIGASHLINKANENGNRAIGCYREITDRNLYQVGSARSSTHTHNDSQHSIL